ncbi:carbohydrate esterase family 16 protein [Xylariaceae sp. FL1019]|nr:carbohydrate esterase family 16 protein [Xylariaceae sp. FL1019]
MLRNCLPLIGLLSATAFADQPLYGQCGGIGYTGSTVCTTGATCTSANAYYYQCVPGTAAATTTTAANPTTTNTSVKTTTTTQATTTTSLPSSTTTASGSSATQYFITFGDSYSQTGFNITTGALPDASNPIGNPTFPGYTTTGGKNWIDDLITDYNKTLLLNYNFAYGGATTDASLVTPYDPSVLSFVDQVTEFSNSIASHPSTTPWTSENTLFGIWMGVNDVGNTWYASNVTDIMDAIMDVYIAQLQILYDAGARNFLLLSVPPIQETPLMLDQGATDDAAEAAIITQYNDLLASNLASFTASNTGVVSELVDTTTPFQTAIDDPTAYGATDATCFNADGSTCLWYNNYHPGMAIHELVAEAIAAGTFKGTFFV